MWQIGILIFILLIFLSAPYVIGPALVYRNQRFRIPAEIVRIEPCEQALPDPIRTQFADSYECLTKLGFDLVGVFGLPKLVTNVQSISALYVNRRTCVVAYTSFIVGTAAVLRYAEFITRYKDGTVVQTNNSAEIGAFPTPAHVHTLQFWDIQEVATLHDLHRFHEARHQKSPPINRVDDEFGGNLERYIAVAAMDEEFARQLETGYLVRCSGGYRPTLKGAVIMTWQLLWPFKAIRKSRRQRNAQQLMGEFRALHPL